jgi:competence transcription factor ComK
MKNPQIVIFIFVLVFIFPTYSKAAEDSLKITKEAHILKSKRLSKKYDAYNVTIENLSPVEIGLSN